MCVCVCVCLTLALRMKSATGTEKSPAIAVPKISSPVILAIDAKNRLFFVAVGCRVGSQAIWWISVCSDVPLIPLTSPFWWLELLGSSVEEPAPCSGACRFLNCCRSSSVVNLSVWSSIGWWLLWGLCWWFLSTLWSLYSPSCSAGRNVVGKLLLSGWISFKAIVFNHAGISIATGLSKNCSDDVLCFLFIHPLCRKYDRKHRQGIGVHKSPSGYIRRWPQTHFSTRMRERDNTNRSKFTQPPGSKMASANLSFTQDGLIYHPQHFEDDEDDEFLSGNSQKDGGNGHRGRFSVPKISNEWRGHPVFRHLQDGNASLCKQTRAAGTVVHCVCI